MEATLGDRLRRIAGTVLPGVVAGIVVALLAGMWIDTPEERALKADVYEYRRALEELNGDMERAEAVLADVEGRDSAVYRTIFGARPVPEARRKPGARDYSRWEGRASSRLIVESMERMAGLEQRLYAQSLSLDEIYKMAGSKKERMASMPAVMPISKKECRMEIGRAHV